MTYSEFTTLLNSDSPDYALSKIGDALVTKVITNDEAYWAASTEARVLYGLCSLLHHAGSNGLVALWDYHQGSQVAVLFSAIEGLKRIGEQELYNSVMEFWNVIASIIAAKNQLDPESFINSDRAEFRRAQKILDSLKEDPIIQEADRLEEASNAFISCWNSSFPRSVVEWVRLHSEHFAQILCVTSETGEQNSGGNGVQAG